MRFRIEARISLVGEGITPSAHGTMGTAEVTGHWAYAPAAVEQGNGHTASDFKLLFRACWSPRDLLGTMPLGL